MKSPERTYAPWNDVEVANLNKFQHCGAVHPFTCANDDHDEHQVLVATRQGWICPDPSCNYTQMWAWEDMANGSMSADAQEWMNRHPE